MRMKVIAVYGLSNNYGLEIYECNDEYVLYGETNGKIHRVKVYTETMRPYFKYGRMRIHLDECFRV